MDHDVAALIALAQKEMAEPSSPNRFLDLLEAGRVPRAHLARLAGELHRLVSSDRRSFAVLAARFPEPPAGDLFLTMAHGEGEALRLLTDFALAAGVDEDGLRAYQPHALTQGYPAFLAQSAAYGPSSAIALALLANAGESGRTYTRVAEALRSQYSFDEGAVSHFRFFAETPQDLLDQAVSTVAAGLGTGEDPAEAVRTARAVHAFEMLFWQTMADGIGEGSAERQVG
ncbi:transcriptional regulator [Actinokineospora sp. 24-640]